LIVTKDKPRLPFGFAKPTIYVPRDCSLFRDRDKPEEPQP
jgi:hypothetical protein